MDRSSASPRFSPQWRVGFALPLLPRASGKKKSKPEVTLSVIEPAPKPTPVGVGADGGGSGEESEAGEPQADPPVSEATPSEGE